MTKISSLSALLGAGVDQATDLLTIVDMSETGVARNKKITVAQLLGLVTDITGLLDFKGSTDCSANPNYPAASKGDFYLVSVAGKIGGASGIVVTAGDTYFATADNAGGTQAGVGTSWTVIQGNVAYVPVNQAGDTMTGDLIVPDEAYDATAWNGSLEVPTKNAVRDKIEAVVAGSGSVSDTVYGVGWDGDTTTAPSKNAVYDKIETLSTGSVSDTVYGAGWNGDTTTAPSKNAVYDKIETLAAAATTTVFEEQRAANVAGGPAVSGAWYGRSLNAEAYDEIGLSLRAATFTVTIASPGLFTWAGHGLVAGSPVVFTTSGALPTGLTAGTTYWVIAAGLTANDFEVSATQGGAAVNTSGSQSGTHTATSSTISLAAGTYIALASAQHFSTDLTRIRLRDLTNSVTLCASDNMYGSNANAGAAAPRIDGKFTLAGTAIVQLDYRATTSKTLNGLGVVSNWGDIEIYSRLKLTKTA